MKKTFVSGLLMAGSISLLAACGASDENTAEDLVKLRAAFDQVDSLESLSEKKEAIDRIAVQADKIVTSNAGAPAVAQFLSDSGYAGLSKAVLDSKVQFYSGITDPEALGLGIASQLLFSSHIRSETRSYDLAKATAEASAETHLAAAACLKANMSEFQDGKAKDRYEASLAIANALIESGTAENYWPENYQSSATQEVVTKAIYDFVGLDPAGDADCWNNERCEYRMIEQMNFGVNYGLSSTSYAAEMGVSANALSQCTKIFGVT